jgi:hypothetical protein
MKSVVEVARELAVVHKQDDPATTDVFLAEYPDEVRLVEVSGSLGATTPREVLPFRFAARPERGVPYPSVVVLLSPLEWEAVQRGELSLPSGWDRDKLQKVG